MEKINKRLEEYRQQLGLNKKQFAEKIGVSQQTYSNYVNGRDIPSSVIQNCYKSLKINLYWLLTGEKQQETSCFFSQSTNKRLLKELNNKIRNFPLMVLKAILFLLEQEETNIATFDELKKCVDDYYDKYSTHTRLNLSTSNFTVKMDPEDIKNYIEYFLTDEDIETIFLNRKYYIKFIYFSIKAKKWI